VGARLPPAAGPELVRERRSDQRTGFFLHTPWPSPDIFARIPWRKELLRGLLGADVVSFHTDGYRRNFVRACGRLLVEDGTRVRGNELHLRDGRVVRTSASPISIDVAQFGELARSPETDAEVEQLRRQFHGRTVLLGVDRLDYTKGILERMSAFEDLLERGPTCASRSSWCRSPCRAATTSRSTARCAARSSSWPAASTALHLPGGDVPVHYLYRSLAPQSLTAYYAVADVMLVTPLIDGMNLVAKEYVAVQVERGTAGVLVLSEFTGAADELRQALLCNPFDGEGLSAKVEQALSMSLTARRRAMAVMGRRVTEHDVHQWVDVQLSTMGGAARGAA
jgi:trehalose 6-phosphate synthase